VGRHELGMFGCFAQAIGEDVETDIGSVNRHSRCRQVECGRQTDTAR
jgi:hypothetical protein